MEPDIISRLPHASQQASAPRAGSSAPSRDRREHALDPAMPSMRCVGYRQAWAHLDGAIDRDGLRAAGIAATRQLAKRQLTWLRATPAARFDPWSDDLAGRVLAAVAGGSR